MNATKVDFLKNETKIRGKVRVGGGGFFFKSLCMKISFRLLPSSLKFREMFSKIHLLKIGKNCPNRAQRVAKEKLFICSEEDDMRKYFFRVVVVVAISINRFDSIFFFSYPPTPPSHK